MPNVISDWVCCLARLSLGDVGKTSDRIETLYLGVPTSMCKTFFKVIVNIRYNQSINYIYFVSTTRNNHSHIKVEHFHSIWWNMTPFVNLHMVAGWQSTLRVVSWNLYMPDYHPLSRYVILLYTLGRLMNSYTPLNINAKPQGNMTMWISGILQTKSMHVLVKDTHFSLCW